MENRFPDNLKKFIELITKTIFHKKNRKPSKKVCKKKTYMRYEKYFSQKLLVTGKITLELLCNAFKQLLPSYYAFFEKW